ncbi:hypothetical protein VNO78_33267 [Psophocarpus tetragonolobus]|uniref:HAT C-terminal dimerisation domain-containing protein n=1 Tax=Psophocarpus tetragonolobus TaxID=3891 RepID=A0AAN9RL69_PSOTE
MFELVAAHVSKSYIPIWEIIDERWDRRLHRPLHIAGYYLNPMLHYNPEFKADFEVKRGLYECLERMVGDMDEISTIDAQFEDFKSKSQFFGSSVAESALQTKTPAQWWECYGDGHLELQKFAIEVLSLTCSSSGFSTVTASWSLDDGKSLDHVGKLLTNASVDSFCKLVKEEFSVPALTCLINAYRAACHNDSEVTSASCSVLSYGLQKSEIFSKILVFMLHEADPTFRKLLGISSSSSRKETVFDLKNTTKWLSLRPLIKSYIRSTMFLLNEVTDSEILAFSICRLRASIIFLFAFPSLMHNLLKISVHL